MASDFEILRSIYNNFDPFRPLPAGDPAYVNCQAVRGDEDILAELGREILYGNRVTHQLYTGHRGAGKSTELLRLQDYLEKHGFRVVYLAADEEDIDREEAQYTDILLACTRHLLKELQTARVNPIWGWMQARRQELSALIPGEITLEDVEIEAQLAEFAKLTATLKASPNTRTQVRKLVEPHTVSLIEAINQFIAEAMQQTPEKSTQKLVLIVDNLDRITRVEYGKGERSNHEQIFLDRSEQLKALDCHVVYTVPLSLVYSGRGTDLGDIYDTEPQVLPMVMVRSLDGQIHEPGLAALRKVIAQRVYKETVVDGLHLTPDVFDNLETLNQLCLMSGGHVRNLMHLAKDAIKHVNDLPITATATRRAITQLRNTYRNTVYEHQWQLLARVGKLKQVENSEAYRELLFNRCILEYRYIDDQGEIQRWHDVHPVIRGIQEFQAAVAALEPDDE